MKVFWVLAAACLGWTATATAAHCDPASPGPFPAALQTVVIPGTAGATLSTDVFFPGSLAAVDSNAVPCPAIVLGHGFSGSKSQHSNTGRHLATRGYIVMIPDFVGGSDHARNAQDMICCLDWVQARNSNSTSILYGQVALGQFGASGYSAGGLSAILAAARDPRIRVLSLLDPVDNNGQGVAALTNISVPVGITYSEASSCNANASAVSLYAAAQGLKRGMKIVGANHTDPQDPANPFAALLCGAANGTRQMLYKRYLTSWFDFYLRGDTSCVGSVFNYSGGQLAADQLANRVTYSAPLSPLTLAAGSSNERFILSIIGPPGQAFVTEARGEAGPWLPINTNQLGSGPLTLSNVATEGYSLFRTRSLAP